MESQELYRGRLIDHVGIVVKDLPSSKTFYKAAFKALNIPVGGEADDHLWADEIYISDQKSGTVQGPLTGRHHLAFQARSREIVDAFYKAVLKAGGRDNGAPGEREYHPGYYAAFVLDPDGNNIEAVYHGPSQKSAEAIQIKFDA